MNLSTFETKFKGGFKKKSFENKHGEKFTVYVTPITVLMGGDETGQEVIPLFNSNFDIWNHEELNKLGTILKELTEGGER